MNTVETVLVVLLAVGFLALIILSIILVSLMIAIMRNIHRISQRAEEATGNISDIAAMISKKIAPLAFSAVAAAALRKIRGK